MWPGSGVGKGGLSLRQPNCEPQLPLFANEFSTCPPPSTCSLLFACVREVYCVRGGGGVHMNVRTSEEI
jgi:hypothetical protein